MAKRGLDESENSTPIITLTNGMIKGYHAFRIKCVPGMELDVRKEVGGRDSKALLCYVPDCLPEEIASSTMESSSSKKTYTMREVQGKPVGRVQYFLNEILSDLLDEGKVIDLKGVVTGLPTKTTAPPPSQKWVKNKQVGGGAYIPCEWTVTLKDESVSKETISLLKTHLRRIDEEGRMEVEVKEGPKKTKL